MMYPHFTSKELACRCGCGLGEGQMDHDFMEIIEYMRRTLRFAFPVTSAYRCQDHNNRVSNTGINGPHTTGKAMDIAVSHGHASRLHELAMESGILGFGFKQHGDDRYLHLDTVSSRIWSYP